MSSSLTGDQEQQLLSVLREHKEASGWTIVVFKENRPLICNHKILLEAEYKPNEKTEDHNFYDPILESMMHKKTDESQAEKGSTYGLTIEEMSGTKQNFKANVGDKRKRLQRKDIPVHHTNYIPPPLCHAQKKLKEKETFQRAIHFAPHMHMGHQVTGLPFEPG